MGRRKDPGSTRAAILAAGLKAFSEHGYDNTTVAELLAATKLSKGAFYHHFDSKEALLEAILDGISKRAAAGVTAALARAPTALAKLECFVSASRQWRSENVATIRMLLPLIMRPDATRLREGLRARTLDLSTPLLAGLLREGAESGEFDIVDPYETARQILTLGNVVGHDQGRDLQLGDAAAIIHRANVYLAHVERMVGIPEQSLSRPSRRLVSDFIKALKEQA
jgi:AcrR family transcriptional regulator